MTIERGRPLYEQIADDLRSRIHSGRYAVDSVLPAEPVLATEYGTSRVTINRAVQMLRSEGLVEVKRGHQTVVVGDHIVLTVHLTPDEVRAVSEQATVAEQSPEQWGADAIRQRLDR